MKKNINKAFTLIELLAVIIILAIILVVAVPKILDAINKSELSTYNNQKDLVSKAAQLYTTTNVNILPTVVGDTLFIKLSDLISSNFIKEIKDPTDKSICNSSNSGVLVTKETDGYKYEPYVQCNNYKSDTVIPTFSTNINSGTLQVNASDGTYLSFDGNDNYASILPQVLNGFRTFEFTFITRELLSASAPSWPATQVLHSNGSNTNNTEFGVHNYGTNLLSIGFGAEGLTQRFLYTNLELNNKYHIVLIIGDSEGYLYVNGSLFETSATMGFNTIGSFAPIVSLVLSAHELTCTAATCNYYKMDMQSMRIWQRPLTSTEVLEGYTNDHVNNSTSLVAEYIFNQITNNIVANTVSSSYPCTVRGAKIFKNSGIKQVRIKQGATLVNSSDLSLITFNLSSGTYTVEVEDNTGNINSKTVIMP